MEGGRRDEEGGSRAAREGGLSIVGGRRTCRVACLSLGESIAQPTSSVSSSGACFATHTLLGMCASPLGAGAPLVCSGGWSMCSTRRSICAAHSRGSSAGRSEGGSAGGNAGGNATGAGGASADAGGSAGAAAGAGAGGSAGGSAGSSAGAGAGGSAGGSAGSGARAGAGAGGSANGSAGGSAGGSVGGSATTTALFFICATSFLCCR